MTNNKKKLGCVIGILRVTVTLPLWYWLIYAILKTIHATDVMWFVFWIYVPISLIVLIITAIFDTMNNDEEKNQ